MIHCSIVYICKKECIDTRIISNKRTLKSCFTFLVESLLFISNLMFFYLFTGLQLYTKLTNYPVEMLNRYYLCDKLVDSTGV